MRDTHRPKGRADIADRTPTIYLHIGPMKTGTSYLQHLMAENRKLLLGAGVLFPGKDPRVDQVRGVRDVMGMHPDGESPATFQGAWAALREEMCAYDGRASVVSQEFMSFARRPRAQALVDSLAPADVHIVLTVRDSVHVLPSAWTNSTRNRGTASWQEYVNVLHTGPQAPGERRRSMRAVNVPRMLRAWGGVVPADNLHVVIVPPPGAPPHVLWERFAQVLGVRPQIFDVATARRGESYGYASADFMRRLNGHLQHLPRPVYHEMKRYLLAEVLERRSGEPKVPITRAVAEFGDRWNTKTVNAIGSSGARVYGDLADIDAVPVVTDEESAASADALLHVAADALSGVRRQLRTEHKQVVEDIGVSPQRWSGTADPVAAAVREVADNLSEVARLLERRASH